MSDARSGPVNRRVFLQSSVASGVLHTPYLGAAAQSNSALEIGIIGCGSRGNYIGNFFTEFTGAKVVALADPLPDRIESMRKNLNCASARAYAGVNGFRELLNSPLDAVVIESPPYFHPEQVAAAVDAGKHVFVAKPIAVDVPGCHTILESARRARGKVSLIVDFQTRARPVFQEAAERIHRGDIGKPLIAQVTYHNGDHIAYTAPEYTDRKASESELQTRLRRWGRDVNLSGDIIVEQDIHMIDVANWFLDSHPTEAAGHCMRQSGSGGSKYFLVQYTYPGGVRSEFSGTSFPHGFRDLCVRIFGTKGSVDSHYVFDRLESVLL